MAAFFNYLSKPDVQAASHQRTGYLPITKAAYELTEKSGFYKKNPGTDVAVKQMIRKTTDKSRGVRLGNFLQIRTIIDEELEQVWAGKKTAKEALDAAVKRGNEQLEKLREGEQAEPMDAPAGLMRPTLPAAGGRCRHGMKARPLPLGLAALGADGAAGGRHRGVLLLAGGAGAAAVVLQQDAFGTSHQWVGLENFRNLFQRPDLPRVVQDHGDLLGAGGRSRHRASRCCWP